MESEYTKEFTVSIGFRERAIALRVLVVLSGYSLNSAAVMALISLSITPQFVGILC